VSELPPPPPPPAGPGAPRPWAAPPGDPSSGGPGPSTPQVAAQEPILHERLDGRERRLHPKVVLTWRIFGGIGMFFPLAGLSIAGALFLEPVRWLVPVLAAIVLLLGVTWYPKARYARWRWQLTDRALEMRYGVMVHRHEAVPYFRVQQIDIERGPVDRMLGLATLQMTISVVYPTPVPKVARKLRERVSTRVQELTGLDVRQVDISVANLIRPPRREGRVR
jgi:uncharacterized protein